MPFQIRLSLPSRPTFMITARDVGERELVYYNNEPGMVINSKRAIRLTRLAAIGIVGLISCGVLAYLAPIIAK